MSSKQTGGQRRTLTARCGYSVAGHPNEVNSLFKRHQRYCDNCRVNDIPHFNAAAAQSNGWDGLGKNRHFVSNYNASTSVHLNGTTYNAKIKMDGHILPTVHNLTLDEMISFIEATPHTTKKKKKQKKPSVVKNSL